MLEKYDPGLITGTIGAVIGIILASIFEKTMIVLRFSKLRKNLKDEVDGLKQKLCLATDGGVFVNMQDLVEDGYKMVSQQRVDVPPWYSVIRRYRESNEMAQLISKIETAQFLLRQTFYLQQILISHQQQTSHQRQTSSQPAQPNQEQTSSLPAQPNQEQTSSLPAQPYQAVAQTYSFKSDTNSGNFNYSGNLMPAILRRWVGIRPANALNMVVLKSVMEDEKIIQKAMKAIAQVKALESITVDVKENKITVIGDADPVSSLMEELRKVGIAAELPSVGSAKEKRQSRDKKEGAKKE